MIRWFNFFIATGGAIYYGGASRGFWDWTPPKDPDAWLAALICLTVAAIMQR